MVLPPGAERNEIWELRNQQKNAPMRRSFRPMRLANFRRMLTAFTLHRGARTPAEKL